MQHVAQTGCHAVSRDATAITKITATVKPSTANISHTPHRPKVISAQPPRPRISRRIPPSVPSSFFQMTPWQHDDDTQTFVDGEKLRRNFLPPSPFRPRAQTQPSTQLATPRKSVASASTISGKPPMMTTKPSNPFKLKLRNNFPAIDSVWERNSRSHGKENGSQASTPTHASLDLSIGARAALYEHMRHVERYGIDGERRCSPKSERSNGEIRHPLDMQWDHLLDAKGGAPSDVPSFCGQLSTSITQSSPARFGRDPNTSSMTADSEDFFNTSRVLQLQTPERHRHHRIEMIAMRSDGDEVEEEEDDDDTDDCCDHDETDDSGDMEDPCALFEVGSGISAASTDLVIRDVGADFNPPGTPSSTLSFDLPMQASTPNRGAAAAGWFERVPSIDGSDLSQIDAQSDMSGLQFTPKRLTTASGRCESAEHVLGSSAGQFTARKAAANSGGNKFGGLASATKFSLSTDVTSDMTTSKISSTSSFMSTPRRSPVARNPETAKTKAQRLLATPRKSSAGRPFRERRTVSAKSHAMTTIASPDMSPITRRSGAFDSTQTPLHSSRRTSYRMHTNIPRSGGGVETSAGSKVSIFDAFAIDFLRAIESSEIASPKYLGCLRGATPTSGNPIKQAPSDSCDSITIASPHRKRQKGEAVVRDMPTNFGCSDRRRFRTVVPPRVFLDAPTDNVPLKENEFTAATNNGEKTHDNHHPKSLFDSFEAVAASED